MSTTRDQVNEDLGRRLRASIERERRHHAEALNAGLLAKTTRFVFSRLEHDGRGLGVWFSPPASLWGNGIGSDDTTDTWRGEVDWIRLPDLGLKVIVPLGTLQTGDPGASRAIAMEALASVPASEMPAIVMCIHSAGVSLGKRQTVAKLSAAMEADE